MTRRNRQHYSYANICQLYFKSLPYLWHVTLCLHVICVIWCLLSAPVRDTAPAPCQPSSLLARPRLAVDQNNFTIKIIYLLMQLGHTLSQAQRPRDLQLPRQSQSWLGTGTDWLDSGMGCQFILDCVSMGGHLASTQSLIFKTYNLGNPSIQLLKKKNYMRYFCEAQHGTCWLSFWTSRYRAAIHQVPDLTTQTHHGFLDDYNPEIVWFGDQQGSCRQDLKTERIQSRDRERLKGLWR